MKTLRTNFVSHTMIICLQPNYIPLNMGGSNWMICGCLFGLRVHHCLHWKNLIILDDAHEDVRITMLMMQRMGEQWRGLSNFG